MKLIIDITPENYDQIMEYLEECPDMDLRNLRIALRDSIDLDDYLDENIHEIIRDNIDTARELLTPD